MLALATRRLDLVLHITRFDLNITKAKPNDLLTMQASLFNSNGAEIFSWFFFLLGSADTTSGGEGGKSYACFVCV